MSQNRETGEMVCHPKHYASENKLYEPYKVINAWGCNFNIGSAIKYLARYRKKWNAIEDLEKAIQYIRFEIESLKEKTARDGTDTESDARSEDQDESDLACLRVGDGLCCVGGSLVSSVDGRVSIPENATSVGNWAFYRCTGLMSVTIPNSVTSIGYWAFACCNKLKSVKIGSRVTSIGHLAFYGCSELESVMIPDSVTYIGDKAFYDCTKLASVVIGNRVKRIGHDAFYGCVNLKSVTIPERFKDRLELIGINPSICRFYNPDKWTYMNF